MTTTPLPRLPRLRKLFENDDHIVVGFINDDMLVYATQARADLEAENQRLREALREIADDYADRFDLESPSTNPGIKYVIKQARAALEKQP